MAISEPAGGRAGGERVGNEPLGAAWNVLQAWLRENPAGRLVLELMASHPERGAEALRERLERAEVPGLSAEVTGGVLGKLVQVASAEAVHIHSAGEGTASLAPVPAELPSGTASFTGRGEEIEQLSTLLEQAGSRRAAAIMVVDGAAGVGKSALTIHVAHKYAAWFPDGQLYVNLQGATPGLAPLDPAEVLGRFLRALGMDGKDIPQTTEEAAARYRSLTSSRRILVVIDNAASAAQVKPLIPAGARCAVLITSREMLATIDGADHLHLDILPAHEAKLLLENFAGAVRVASEPDAAATIAMQCGRLPLALRIAGARLAARPNWPLRALADRLTDERTRLNELQLGDLAVRASFMISYEALRTTLSHAKISTSRIFRLLGLWEGPDVGVGVAAALVGHTSAQTQESLELLVDAQLLETPSPGRYRMHDLLRLFAREHANTDEAESDRRQALGRALAHCLSTARVASRLLQPIDPRRTASTPVPGCEFGSRAEALLWLEAERPNLVSATRQAATGPAEFAEIATELADAMFWFCHLRVYPRDLESLGKFALSAAQRIGDRAGQGQTLHNLCIACLRLRRFGEAIAYGEKSLVIRRELGDRYGEGRTLDALGRIHQMQGKFSEAIRFGEASLAIAREIGDQYSESAVLCNLVPAYQALKRFDEAIACGQESLAIRSKIGDRYGEGRMRISLGAAYEASGRLSEAIACFEQSLEIFRDIGDRYDEGRALFHLAVEHRLLGVYPAAIEYAEQSLTVRRETADRYGEAETLRELGGILADAGHVAEAHTCWSDALGILRELGSPAADEVQKLLSDPSCADDRAGLRAARAKDSAGGSS
jgi:tetratricopeptide (TPR) repeat protein